MSFCQHTWTSLFLTKWHSATMPARENDVTTGNESPTLYMTIHIFSLFTLHLIMFTDDNSICRFGGTADNYCNYWLCWKMVCLLGVTYSIYRCVHFSGEINSHSYKTGGKAVMSQGSPYQSGNIVFAFETGPRKDVCHYSPAFSLKSDNSNPAGTEVDIFFSTKQS